MSPSPVPLVQSQVFWLRSTWWKRLTTILPSQAAPTPPLPCTLQAGITPHSVSYHPQHPTNPVGRMPCGSGSPRPKEALHPNLGCYRLGSRRYQTMCGVVSLPCIILQLPGESSIQDSQRGPPCHETKLPLHVPLSSWGLSGHQQDQAGTSMEEKEKEYSSAAMPAPPLSLFLLASPPRAHSLLPPGALLVPAASNYSFPPAPAALNTSMLPHADQNTLHHSK